MRILKEIEEDLTEEEGEGGEEKRETTRQLRHILMARGLQMQNHQRRLDTKILNQMNYCDTEFLKELRKRYSVHMTIGIFSLPHEGLYCAENFI